jgi:hypothetical protein
MRLPEPIALPTSPLAPLGHLRLAGSLLRFPRAAFGERVQHLAQASGERRAGAHPARRRDRTRDRLPESRCAVRLERLPLPMRRTRRCVERCLERVGVGRAIRRRQALLLGVDKQLCESAQLLLVQPGRLDVCLLSRERGSAASRRETPPSAVAGSTEGRLRLLARRAKRHSCAGSRSSHSCEGGSPSRIAATSAAVVFSADISAWAGGRLSRPIES